ncbi:hypothetical protein ACMFMG_007150 [Clarireedia jacksonii]
MGYYENFCQICGVSFNLARVRTKHEPPEDGWGYSSGLYYMGDETSTLCASRPEESGCKNVSVEGDGIHPDQVHIAGPGCVFTGGYSGHRITAEEMKDMRLTRYIIPKPENTVDEEDAPDYEKCSDYFISDQSITTQDHFEPGELPRIRYGVDYFFVQNSEVVADPEVAVPVHAACWKIFEHVSKRRFGRIDLQGFMALWQRQACGTCGFQNIKHDRMLQKCKQQWWEHLPGTEYFAANPCDIPGFSLIMQDQYSEYANRAASGKERPEPKYWVNSTDPFMKLPAELKMMLLMELDSKNIRNLRLVSRAFRELPQQVFRHLILEELPWFWEIDEIHKKRQECDRDLYIKMYGEDLSKMGDRLDGRYRQKVKDTVEGKYSPETDWKNVYQTLKMLEKGRLGVQNRVRIWGLVEDIVGRIEELRETPEAHKRYELRGEGEDLLDVQPTEEEKEKGMVTHEYNCLGCQYTQIERMVEDEDES